MTDEPHDIDTLAEGVWRAIEYQSGQRMPKYVMLVVVDQSTRFTAGWVTCQLDNRYVRCLVPGNWDTSAGVLLVALPPSKDEPGLPYLAVGAFGSEGADNGSYVPRVVAPNYGTVTTDENGDTTQGDFSGTDEKAKVSSNDTTAGYLDGKLVAGSNITLTQNNDGGDETLTIASSGVSDFTDLGDVPSSYSGAAGQVVAVNSGETALEFITLTVSRQQLTADLTYYVRTDGSDSNDGLTNSAGGAFLTIQRAIDEAANRLDLGGYTVTIQVGDGTYTDPINIKAMMGMAGPDSLVIQGNSLAPSNVVISTTSADSFTLDGPTTMAHVKYLKVQTTTGGMGFSVVNQAVLKLTGINFGACANYHMLVNGGARLQFGVGEGYTISGGATFHMSVQATSTLQAESVGTITLSGTPNFSTFALVSDSNLRINGNTYSGSATGKRYNVNLNGVIFTNGAGVNYLPGSIAGTTATGGQYA